MQPSFYEDMVHTGIPIVFTDLSRLRHSNFLYAKPALFYGPLLNRIPFIKKWLDKPRFSNPLNSHAGKITTRQLANLPLFKANHRKVMIAGVTPEDIRAIATSLNPANGSSAHDNIGLLFKGPLAVEAALAELACIRWSAKRQNLVLEQTPGLWQTCAQQIDRLLPDPQSLVSTNQCHAQGQWLTEGAIKDKIITLLNESEPGDQVRIAMFYLSDRDVITAIKHAAFGGAYIKIILDANKDAFGRTKNGIPNRIVAHELHSAAKSDHIHMEIRWADTHGEQFHTKAMTITNPKQDKFYFLCGSANWTRRNLADLNMEANIFISNAPSLTDTFNTYFNRIWHNNDQLIYTCPITTYDETGIIKSIFRRWRYRIQEATGLSTF